MPLDPAGNASLIPSYFAEPGTTIRTDQHNPVLEDIAAMLSAMLVRDGRNGMVGPLDMGTFPIRNVAPGVNPTDVATVSQGMPIAAIIDYAGGTAPSGWMFCYGQALSRTAYAALFAAIGTQYGAGDGSTTFNVPDIRGRVTAGRDTMGGTTADRMTAYVNGTLLGATGGAQSHVLTQLEMPAHQHAGSTSPSGDHTHGIGVNNNSIAGLSGIRAGNTGPSGVLSSDPGGNHSHTFVTDVRGGNNGHPNVQPTIILNKIIKVSL